MHWFVFSNCDDFKITALVFTQQKYQLTFIFLSVLSVVAGVVLYIGAQKP